MTKYVTDYDNHFNTFISSSIRELVLNNVCYVYTNEQIDIISKVMLSKYKKNIYCEKNECGYTLRTKRKENK